MRAAGPRANVVTLRRCDVATSNGLGVRRPRLLDLCCCAGGAGMGYARAGFDVVGVDLVPSRNNPHPVIVADALEYLRAHGHEYDAIHASPPCQRYARVTLRNRHGSRESHPDMVGRMREALQATGRPWVMENVPEAPLLSPIVLCGLSFGLGTLRHRAFEASFLILAPGGHVTHPPNARKAGLLTVAGHRQFAGDTVGARRAAMGIDWPMTNEEVTQAIPPAYTEFIGRQLLRVVSSSDGRGRA